jgi:hypothetical protein
MKRNIPPLHWFKVQSHQVQKSIIQFLEKKESRLTRAQKKIYFFLFMLIFGGYFGYCLVAGLAGQGSSTVGITAIKRPVGQHQDFKTDSVKIK